jgi:DNA-binding transcriptional ArsR family regulator
MIGRAMYSDQSTEDERLIYHADLLSQLSNPKRLEVCIHLSGHEEDVNSLAKKLGISQSALSQHLTRLHHSGIVKVRRQAQFRYYTCDHPGVLQILKTLAGIFDAELKPARSTTGDNDDHDEKS